jgi:hypothetical protein
MKQNMKQLTKPCKRKPTWSQSKDAHCENQSVHKSDDRANNVLVKANVHDVAKE